MTQDIKPTEEEQIEAELIQRILTGDWTPGQVATFEALHDPEFGPDDEYIAGLNAEIERLLSIIVNYREETKRAAEEFEKQDKVISALDQQLCEARTELSRKQSELIKAKRFLRMIYLEANDDGGRVYLSGKQMSQISEMIKND